MLDQQFQQLLGAVTERFVGRLRRHRRNAGQTHGMEGILQVSPLFLH
jgi:hypothetical protein